MTIEAKKKGRTSKKPSAEVLSLQYSMMTAKMIAEFYGVSESTVKRWIADYRKQEAQQNA